MSVSCSASNVGTFHPWQIVQRPNANFSLSLLSGLRNLVTESSWWHSSYRTSQPISSCRDILRYPFLVQKVALTNTETISPHIWILLSWDTQHTWSIPAYNLLTRSGSRVPSVWTNPNIVRDSVAWCEGGDRRYIGLVLTRNGEQPWQDVGEKKLANLNVWR